MPIRPIRTMMDTNRLGGTLVGTLTVTVDQVGTINDRVMEGRVAIVIRLEITIVNVT
jgi:hypothetical protein